MSATPPGGNATIMMIGRVGYASCAAAGRTARAHDSAPNNCLDFMTFLLLSPPLASSRSCSAHRILQGADGLDRDRYDIAFSQVLRGIEADADACAGARGDHVARLQRHDAR